MMIFHKWKIISSDGNHLFFHFSTQTTNRNYDINSIKSGIPLWNNWAIEHVADFDKDLELTLLTIRYLWTHEIRWSRADKRAPMRIFRKIFWPKVRWTWTMDNVVSEALVTTRIRVTDPLQSVFKKKIYWNQLTTISNKSLIWHTWR